MPKKTPVELHRAYIRAECNDYEAALAPSSADEEVPQKVYEPRWKKEKGRSADVVFNKKGEVTPGNGLSTFDKSDVFPAKKWSYFPIPAGIEYDDSLKLVGPDYSKNFNANHYQFEPKYPLRPSEYLGMLSNIARASIKARYEAARGK